MIKKTITYTDFNGNQQTEDFYFNLTKAELAEMELSGEGNSLKDHIERIVKSEDGKQIIETFKAIIKKSYGVRSSDGKRFYKNEEAWQDFAASEAYSVLFMELATSSENGANFINGLVPAGTAAQPAAQDGFRPGYDPNYRPTPPAARQPEPTQPIEQAPDQSQAAQPVENTQPHTYDPSQDRGPQSFPPAPQQ